MTRLRKALATFFGSLLTGTAARAQNSPDAVEMADAMRSNGKIFVVVAVMATILAGILLYLVRMDRRVTRLEKEKD
jgi:bacteriorhodopsin